MSDKNKAALRIFTKSTLFGILYGYATLHGWSEESTTRALLGMLWGMFAVDIVDFIETWCDIEEEFKDG